LDYPGNHAPRTPRGPLDAAGAYQGVTGRVLSNKTTPNTNNQSDIVVRINRR
jgi:hypothetical protein